VAKLPRPAILPPLEAEDLRILPAGTVLWRVYFAGGGHPSSWGEFRDFGPVKAARFDHHVPPPRRQDRAILYAAEQGPTCFAEAFQAARVINRTRRTPWLVSFALAREVRLLDLAGAWPTRAGASQAVSSGPRSRAREWSRAVHEQYPEIEGLGYPSSMLGETRAVALYERAREALPTAPAFHVPLTHPGLQATVQRIAARLGYRLV
jgi:RES domain